MKDLRSKKVGVLMGGLSSEREISLLSGKAVYDALKDLGYRVVALDVGMDIARVLEDEKIEVAFIALHGKFGEDGTLQGLLEMMHIPYTGSGVLASSLAMDKYLTKEILNDKGIALPCHRLFDAQRDSVENFIEKFDLAFPVFIKPSREGSSIGIARAKNGLELEQGLEVALKCDSRILVEEYIQGAELTVGVLDQKTFPPIEIVPGNDFYDFDAKYTKGKTQYLIPARLSLETLARLERHSRIIFDEIGCEGLARVDFLVRKEVPYFLEINTIPGMTETSLVPKAAAHLGMSFSGLVEALLETARLKVH